MSINVTFNGSTIYKPGAYSKEIIDLGGGFPVGPTGIVAIFGEAVTGPPGSTVSDITTQAYSPDQLPAIQALYGSGPIVDACSFLFAPGADGAIPGGAQQVFIYKTNNSTLADLALAPFYTFTITSSTVNAGAVYANNGFEYTVVSNISAQTSLQTTGTGAPAGSGTLVLLSGTGPATIAFSAVSGAASYGELEAQAYGTTGNLITYTDVAVPPTSATTTSTAFFDATSSPFVSGGDTMVLRIQGAATSLDNTFTLPANVTPTRATLQTALNTGGNWSEGLPSGMTFTVSGGADAAAYVTIAQNQSMNSYTQGHGTNFDLISGSLLAVINIVAGLYTSETEDMAVITINNTGTLTSESGTVGGTIVLNLGYTGSGSVGPVVTVTSSSLLLINNSIIQFTIPLANYPSLYSLVQFINSSTSGKWTAALPSTLVGQLPATCLDEVTNLGANSDSGGSLPAQIKNDAYNTVQFFAQSSIVTLTQAAGQGVVGLPTPQGPIYLAGGLLGGTQSADIPNALTSISSVHINSVVPLFSRDASQDILDMITDPSSNYTIDAIHQAVKTFLSMQATTKTKNECQGYLSLKDTYLNCKLEAQNMADARIQLFIQDQMEVNSLGNLVWFLPWAGACLVAGARGGSPVGLPMTFKYFNTSGIRQTGQLLSTPESQIVIDFNPQTQYDDAIMNGITFWEKPLTGGFRLVVDNTTYGADANWVYNRANVLYAADVLAYDFRNQLENIYVGAKNTVSAAEVKSTCDSILTTYLAQGITVSTTDAPSGYKQLVVQIVGNTINISVVVKLVEGIDFVLATITLQRATSSA